MTAALLMVVGPQGMMGQASNASTEDLDFIQSAARAGLAEIRLGQLALQRASSQAVKGLAQRMVDDSTRSNRELAEIAQRKGIIFPTEAGPVSGQSIDHATGAEFDRLFPDVVVADHLILLERLERLLRDSNDLDLKNWATKNLLTLRPHLADAKALQLL